VAGGDEHKFLGWMGDAWPGLAAFVAFCVGRGDMNRRVAHNEKEVSRVEGDLHKSRDHDAEFRRQTRAKLDEIEGSVSEIKADVAVLLDRVPQRNDPA
jgi:hypothetical protein